MLRLATSLALAPLLLALACSGDKPSGKPAAGGQPAVGAGPAAGQTPAGTTAPVGGESVVKPPSQPPPPLPADSGEHSGAHRFSLRMGGPLADAGRSVAIDRQGTTLVAGYLRGAVDLGGGQTITADDADGFVASLGKDGALRWARNFGGKGDDAAEAVAVDGEGNVLVGGAFSYSIEMTDGRLESKGADDAFVVKLAPDGRRLWAKRFGGLGVDAIYGLATDAAGNVFLVGEIGDQAVVGDSTLTSAGGADIFLAKLSPDGAPLWARRFGGPAADYGRAVRTTADGGVVFLGEMSREVDFGGGPLKAVGNRDAVVVALGADGSYRWATSFGGTNDELALGLALDPVGSVIVSGSYDSPVELAGTTLRSAGLADIYLAKFGPDGAPLWAKGFGSKEADIGAGLATDAQGNIYAVGWFWYEVDFGTGPLTSAGRKDSVALAIAPDGATRWARRFGSTENDFLQAIACGPDGAPVAVGTFHRSVSYGGAELTANAASGASIPLGDVTVVGLQR